MGCDGQIVHNYSARIHERESSSTAKKCAYQIRVNDPAKLLGRKPVNICQMVSGSGVVDQEVERLKALAHSLKQLVHLIRIGNVATFRRKREIFTLELLNRRFKRSRI